MRTNVGKATLAVATALILTACGDAGTDPESLTSEPTATNTTEEVAEDASLDEIQLCDLFTDEQVETLLGQAATDTDEEQSPNNSRTACNWFISGSVVLESVRLMPPADASGTYERVRDGGHEITPIDIPGVDEAMFVRQGRSWDLAEIVLVRDRTYLKVGIRANGYVAQRDPSPEEIDTAEQQLLSAVEEALETYN